MAVFYSSLTSNYIFDDEVEICEETFFEMVQNSIEQSTSLRLCGKRVHLKSALKLKRPESLIICGGTIVGEGHSIFAMNTDRNQGPPALTLKHVKLFHTKSSEDRREIGAAVFVMGKAKVIIEDCFVYSVAGFGIWLKHDSCAKIERTIIAFAGRSSLVVFNNAQVECYDCELRNAAIHGVCLRGKAKASLHQCLICDCGVRSGYVYEQAELGLFDSIITRNKASDTPALHATALYLPPSLPAPSCSSSSSSSSSSLVPTSAVPVISCTTSEIQFNRQKNKQKNSKSQQKKESNGPILIVQRCQVSDNAGPDVLIDGNVSFTMEDNAMEKSILFPRFTDDQGSQVSS